FARRQGGQSVQSLLYAITVCLGCVLVPICSAADWPNWRGPHYDGISRETGLLKSWPKEGPKVLWEGKLTGGYSSVVVAGGRVFTQMKDNKEEVILCLDADTGKRLWQYRYPCDYADYPSLDKRFGRGAASLAGPGGKARSAGPAGGAPGRGGKTGMV